MITHFVFIEVLNKYILLMNIVKISTSMYLTNGSLRVVILFNLQVSLDFKLHYQMNFHKIQMASICLYNYTRANAKINYYLKHFNY